MSSPVPPPPWGSGAGPGRSEPYTRAQRRAHSRWMAAQARSARQQEKARQRDLRLHRRALHRSVVGPVLILSLGVLLLLVQTGYLDWTQLLAWYSRWWPALLVGAGALLLLEWLLDQRRGASATLGPRVLGPGVGGLLVLLAALGWSLSWFNGEGGRSLLGLSDPMGLSRLLSHEFEWDDTLVAKSAAGLPLTLQNPKGSVTISGSSSDGQVHITLHERIYALQESGAQKIRQRLQPRFRETGGGIVFDVPAVAGAEADLMVEVPALTELVLRSEHGDVSISRVAAPVSVFSRSGDLSLSDLRGSVTLRVEGDASAVSGRNLAGPVRVQGRAGDLTFSNVEGALALQGDFFGSTHLDQINGPVLFQTSRTRFEAARLGGSLDLDGGPGFHATDIVGPVTLQTKNRTISLEKVVGSVKLSNRNGSVAVDLSQPMGAVDITNERGSVDLELPQGSGFRIRAEARNGDIENDFGLTVQSGDRNVTTLTGNVDTGGPEIDLSTTDGGITIRKQVTTSSKGRSSPRPPRPPTPPSQAKQLKGSPPALTRM